MNSNELHELKKILDVAKEEVPELISNVMDGIYNAESGEKLAEDTANFYKRLVDAGMKEDQAFELTREFMRSRDVSALAKQAIGRHGLIGSNVSSVDEGEKSGDDA